MNYRPMLTFLSEDSIKAHMEYLRGERLRHSIEEKSLPEIKGKSVREIENCDIKRAHKRETISRLVNIRLHECYFSSFCENPAPSPLIRRFYSSEEALLYEALMLTRESDGGFLTVSLDARSRPRLALYPSEPLAYRKYTPLLAVDLCEHAYFSDYSYNREKYLRNALIHLDLSRLEKEGRAKH